MSVKDIRIKPVPSGRANEFVKEHHYSGRVVPNSQLHLGAYYYGSLEGVMQFGPPMDREKLLGLVEGTGWNEMMELNRMAFSDALPKNSESRSLSVAFKLFKKHAPHVKWVVSFADASQCGDGAIYRASNFALTGITTNKTQLVLPSGETISSMTVTAHSTDPRPELGGRTVEEVTGGSCRISDFKAATGAECIKGHQLRYIYFIDNDCRDRLTVKEIPYDRIDEIGAGMYKGERVSIEERKPDQ